jgi:hypothetical protein
VTTSPGRFCADVSWRDCETRQQLGCRGFAHQLGDPLRIAGASISRRCRTGPLPSGSHGRRRRA